MVVNELDFCATGLAVDHTCASGDTYDKLFVQGTTDGAAWELCDEGGGGAEDATFGATHILPVDEEMWVALGEFCQSLVDGGQQGGRTPGAAWGILLPCWHIDSMLHHA